jgi:hypothetical protein
MTVQKFVRLCTALGLAAGSALLSYPAAAQLYFQPPPPPQVYYPPQVDPNNFPPRARPMQVEPEGLPPPARTYGMPPTPRTANREDVPGADAAPGTGENPENRENNVSVTTTTPVSAVSLRDGPSSGSSIIGTLRPGMPLEVLGAAKGGWVQVRSSAGTGWAYGSYLAIGTRGIAPASAGDVGNSAAQNTDVTSALAAKSAVGGSPIAGNSATKPLGTANPALTGGGPALVGGGPALGIGRSAEPGRSGLASQITSP